MLNKIEQFLDYLEDSNTSKIKLYVSIVISILLAIGILFSVFYFTKDISLFKEKPIKVEQLGKYQTELIVKLKEDIPYNLPNYEIKEVNVRELSGVNNKNSDVINLNIDLLYVHNTKLNEEQVEDAYKKELPLIIQGTFNKSNGNLEEYKIY